MCKPESKGWLQSAMGAVLVAGCLVVCRVRSPMSEGTYRPTGIQGFCSGGCAGAEVGARAEWHVHAAGRTLPLGQ